MVQFRVELEIGQETWTLSLYYTHTRGFFIFKEQSTAFNALAEIDFFLETRQPGVLRITHVVNDFNPD